MFCQLEEPTNGYNRIIESSPFFISLSNHKVSKRFWILRGEKNYEWCRIAPNGLIWSINFQNFYGGACSQTPQKGLPPSALTTVLFNHLCSCSLIFSLFKWSVQLLALWYRLFTCKPCVCVCVFSELWIYLQLYIVKEGFSFFLMHTFHSPLIRYGRGGGGDLWYHSDFFFIIIQICLSWRVAGLLIFVSPKP